MKISTKKGDGGETGLFDGQRVSKCDCLVEALGALDELQAVLGMVKVEASDGTDLVVLVERMQADIYRMMSVVGFEMKCPAHIEDLAPADVEFLEREVERYEELVGEIREFVLPGQGELEARLQVARTVCRRAERWLVRCGADGVPAPEVILQYVNRMSDLLFLLAMSAAE